MATTIEIQFKLETTTEELPDVQEILDHLSQNPSTKYSELALFLKECYFPTNWNENVLNFDYGGEIGIPYLVFQRFYEDHVDSYDQKESYGVDCYDMFLRQAIQDLGNLFSEVKIEGVYHLYDSNAEFDCSPRYYFYCDEITPLKVREEYPEIEE